MSQAAILRKEIQEFLRDRRFVLAALLVVVLAIAALLLAQQRVARYEHDRVMSETQDRETWLGQGARNPHGAAHFSTWAFRPLTPVAMLDPGVSSFAGVAIWMEAHNQNPAAGRAAEDRAHALDAGEFSIAWVLQVIVPLLVFVIAAGLVARERESGTLRLMIVAGMDARRLPLQKAWSLTAIVAAFLLPLAFATALAAAMAPVRLDADQLQRLALWALAHLVFLGIAVAIAVAVSAQARSVSRALLILVAFWLVAVLLAPRVGASVAEAVAPMPSGQEFFAQIDEDLGEADVFDPDDPATKALEARVLSQYGVARLEDLPVSFAGIQLDEAEKHGNSVFDHHYRALRAIEDRQRDVMRIAAILSPLVALQNVSSGLAGTDLAHQRSFASQAEAHRRLTVGQLNADMTEKGAGQDFDYIADADLWRQIPSFQYRAPTWFVMASVWWIDAAILMAWFGVAVLIMRRSGRALVKADS